MSGDFCFFTWETFLSLRTPVPFCIHSSKPTQGVRIWGIIFRPTYSLNLSEPFSAVGAQDIYMWSVKAVEVLRTFLVGPAAEVSALRRSFPRAFRLFLFASAVLPLWPRHLGVKPQPLRTISIHEAPLSSKINDCSVP